jgi:hypothetical protein
MDHVSYTHDKSTVAFPTRRQHPEKGRGKVRQSYDEEKVLVFLDNPAGILVPDILYSGESPTIVTSSLDVFQV